MCWDPHDSGFAGLRVRISIFQTRYKIPVGFRVVPAPAPAGTNPDPNPRPAGRVSAGTRVFCTSCHLYSWPYQLPRRGGEDHIGLSRTVPGHINSNITDMSGTKNKPTIQRGWIDLPIPKTPQIEPVHPAARTMHCFMDQGPVLPRGVQAVRSGTDGQDRLDSRA